MIDRIYSVQNMWHTCTHIHTHIHTYIYKFSVQVIVSGHPRQRVVSGGFECIRGVWCFLSTGDVKYQWENTFWKPFPKWRHSEQEHFLKHMKSNDNKRTFPNNRPGLTTTKKTGLRVNVQQKTSKFLTPWKWTSTGSWPPVTDARLSNQNLLSVLISASYTLGHCPTLTSFDMLLVSIKKLLMTSFIPA